jgi:hypothetical protein
MAPKLKPLIFAAALSLAAGAACAQAPSPLDWSQTAARGLYDLCREDAPDAALVAGHGEVWGWPPFGGYTEHPEGYKREAGGESRRTYVAAGETAYVEATIQSGVVTSVAPANLHYFRCNLASDHPVDTTLRDYFTNLYGKPVSDTADATVWLTGAAATPGATGQGWDAENDALHAVTAAGAGKDGMRIELSHDNGLDRAKMILFVNAPPTS